METTWKPTVAGILDILAGAFGFIALVFVVMGAGLFMIAEVLLEVLLEGTNLPIIAPALLFTMSIPLVAAQILAIVGGVYALKRKKWGWALTGSIAAIFLSWPLAVAAIAFTVMAKNEFE